MLRLLLPFLLLGIPVLDVVLDVLLVRRFGFLYVFLYLVAAFAAGVLAVRYAGPITIVRATRRLRGGEAPTREILDGLLMLVGGLYLIFPGPASDVVAILLIVPGLRRLPRSYIGRRFDRRPRAEGPIDVEDYRLR